MEKVLWQLFNQINQNALDEYVEVVLIYGALNLCGKRRYVQR